MYNVFVRWCTGLTGRMYVDVSYGISGVEWLLAEYSDMLFHCGLQTDRAVEAVDAEPRLGTFKHCAQSLLQDAAPLLQITTLRELGVWLGCVLMLQRDSTS